MAWHGHVFHYNLLKFLVLVEFSIPFYSEKTLNLLKETSFSSKPFIVSHNKECLLHILLRVEL
jgi:hypothetical protein